MVRILSTGEIVQDDDPRLRPGGANGPSRNRMGHIQHDEDDEDRQRREGQGGRVGNQAASVFDAFSERLRALGIPRWNLGPYVVEPIVSVGFLVALLLAGFRGLIFAGILFFVSKYSQQGGFGGWFGGNPRGPSPGRGPPPSHGHGQGTQSGQPGQGQGNNGGRKWGSGEGQRLGHS
ncbi:protein FAM241B-like [Lineus longissimus]|uniref:protein FAM241B-like n=1 Tax=Lineus longissimus TaxID=88925 RepID=UPI002B4F9904